MPRNRAIVCAFGALVVGVGCVPQVTSGCATSLPAAILGSTAPHARAGGTSKQHDPPPPWSSVPVPGPGARVLAVAERMVSDGTVVVGSCYDYISSVFSEAGYPSRRRERIFRSSSSGPYADLSAIAPGDWLAIVNHPERDPVGTHSVIFVRWFDRARGEAEVVSYAGGGQDRPGDIVVYDVTRTYRITRATDVTPP